ncbi:MAG: hypothetical protein KatS3mg110_4212 [Pirellulaceae bacterium]|nr:MAG: hypothetical protein KatS3mg110_4212 [Pirellulaceae bacterium]
MSVDELIAFNEELLLLAQAGMPLEEGLLRAARQLPGNAARLAEAVGQHLAEGQSWQEVFDRAPHLFPPAYRALVETGLRTGRLAAVLSHWLDVLRLMARLQRTLSVAVVYPILVALLSYILFVASFVVLAPPMVTLAHDFQLLPESVVATIERMAATWYYWAPSVPVVLALAAYGVRRVWPSARLVPVWLSLQQTTRLGQEIVFLKVLAQLLTTGTTLLEALPLAASASGSRALQQDAQAMAERLQRGETQPAPPIRNGVPISIRLALMQGLRLPQLLHLINHRVDEQLALLEWQVGYQTRLLPLMLTLIIGMPCVVVYALLVLGPWYWVLGRVAANVATR